MKWILLRLAVIGAFAHSGELLGGDWKDKWMAEMDSIHNKPRSEQIVRLGTAVRAKSTDRGSRPTEDQLAVAERAVALLTAIPGHAEYHRDRILDAQEHLKSVWEDGNLAGPACGRYRDELMYGFQTLPHLPSSETVRVYGELLSNDWVPPGNETAPISGKLIPLSETAAVGLAKLPIRNKPFTDRLTFGNIADGHAAWLRWYEEIKSGKRTFRFEGDPVEYDLNGPAPGQKVDRIARDTKRERERAAGRKDTGPRGGQPTDSSVEIPSKSAPAALIAAGALALGTLVWYVSRARVSKEP